MEHESLKKLSTAIEQLVDERISHKLRELQNRLEILERDSQNTPTDEFLTLQDVCKITGLQKQTIYGLRSRREIPAYKFGSALRFKRSEIEEWMNSKKVMSLNGQRLERKVA